MVNFILVSNQDKALCPKETEVFVTLLEEEGVTEYSGVNSCFITKYAFRHMPSACTFRRCNVELYFFYCLLTTS